MTKKVTIIVPLRNAERFITGALTSILQETIVDLEVVVVDDKSTDSSVSRVLELGDHRVRLVDGPGRGIAACLNAGIAAARGQIIMRCDADDMFPVGRIGEQVGWLSDQLQFDAVCGGFATIDADGRLLRELPCGAEIAEITSELTAGSTRTHLGAFAVRSSLIARLGGFREFFEVGEDVDFQLRLGEAGRVLYIPKIWYAYRLHANSITHINEMGKLTYFETIARELQRQRLRVGRDDLESGRPMRSPTLAGSSRFSVNQHMQDMLISGSWHEHSKNKKMQSLTMGIRAIIKRPRTLAAWKSLFALILKSSARRER
jgi:glycosyltransferase involved in cell wall biosynthesis